jgi:hypothetical protein
VDMTQEEIFEMARQSDLGFLLGDNWMMHHEFEAFAKLIAEQTQIEMQDRINTLHAMYEQACKQRDELMDAQRSMVAAMRGKMQ